MLRTLRTFLPSDEVKPTSQDNDMCATEVFCGFPGFFIFLDGMEFWMKAKERNMVEPAKLKLLDIIDGEIVGQNDTLEMKFALHMKPPQVTINIVVDNNVTLTSGELLMMSIELEEEGRTIHVTKIDYGKELDDDGSFEFTLKLEVKVFFFSRNTEVMIFFMTSGFIHET